MTADMGFDALESNRLDDLVLAWGAVADGTSNFLRGE